MFGELLIDLKFLQPAKPHEEQEDQETVHWVHLMETILHYGSLAILSIFMLEVILRIAVFRMEYFKQPAEVFDGIIVTISFILDIVLTKSHGIVISTGFLISLRLWRIVRLCHGKSKTLEKQI